MCTELERAVESAARSPPNSSCTAISYDSLCSLGIPRLRSVSRHNLVLSTVSVLAQHSQLSQRATRPVNCHPAPPQTPLHPYKIFYYLENSGSALLNFKLIKILNSGPILITSLRVSVRTCRKNLVLGAKIN